LIVSMGKKMLSRLASLPHDKLLHSFYGTLLFTLAMVVVSPLAALLGTLAVAVGKEAWDKVSGKGTPDVWDIVATIGLPLCITGVL